jgi:hypothetical protein
MATHLNRSITFPAGSSTAGSSTAGSDTANNTTASTLFFNTNLNESYSSKRNAIENWPKNKKIEKISHYSACQVKKIDLTYAHSMRLLILFCFLDRRVQMQRF